MSATQQLSERIWKRASELRRDVELLEEADEHISLLNTLLDNANKQNNEMRAALERIASTVHCGGLNGFGEVNACLTEVRLVSFKWLNKQPLKRT